jgi:hypothetical protein
MDRVGIPMCWTAICAALHAAVTLVVAPEPALVTLFLISVTWHASVLVPFWVRIYFSASVPRDLLVDVLDLLDVMCASAALHGWLTPPWHVQYACGLLFIQMGLRPTAARPMALASASVLADVEYARIQQEADLRVLPSMSGAPLANMRRHQKGRQ